MSPSRSTNSAENPDSPSSPTPAPSTTSRLFAPIASPPIPETDHSGPSPSPSEDSPGWSTEGPADPYSSDPGEPSGIPSTGKADLKVSKAGLRSAVGTGFRSLCRAAAAFVATEQEREYGVWTPDDEDVADVARPATNIIYRRLPDEAKGGDIIDLFALGLALVGYLGKNLQLRAQVRALTQLQAVQGDPSGEAGTP